MNIFRLLILFLSLTASPYSIASTDYSDYTTWELTSFSSYNDQSRNFERCYNRVDGGFIVVCLPQGSTIVYGYYTYPPSDTTDIEFSFSETVAGITYTNQQCVDQFGAAATATGIREDGSGSSCNLPQPTDEYCQGLDPKPLRAPGSLQPGETITASGCSWQVSTNPSIDVSYPNGDWSAIFEPVGAAPDAPETSEGLDPPESDLGTGWDDPENGLTPTTDTALDCPWSYVSASNGDTYCYEGEDANVGSDYPDGSTRVDHFDGSYTITDGSGNSTTYNPDGTQKEQPSAPTSPGSGPSGDGTSGTEIGLLKQIADGIEGMSGGAIDFSGISNSINDGFEGLEDSLTEEAPEADSLIAGSNLDELSDQVDQEAEAHTGNVTDKLDEIGDGEGSPIADQVTGNFPDLPSSSCSPITFGQSPFEFTISCDVFNKIRTWFGWIIYFWTAVSIMDTFFAPVSRRA